MPRHKVARAEDIPAESLRQVVVDGTEICLAHAEDGNFYAINDICTHENFNLSMGELFGLDVECPQHGSRFNLKTGKVSGPPAVVPTKVYSVSVEEGDVLVEVDG